MITESGMGAASLLAGVAAGVPAAPPAPPPVAPAPLAKEAINQGIDHHDTSALYVIVVIFLISAVVYGVATYAQTYSLEYGEATVEVHTDAVAAGQRVLLVDDVLATGGTAAAARVLLERCGAEVVGLAVLIELEFLHGRDLLPFLPVTALLSVA